MTLRHAARRSLAALAVLALLAGCAEIGLAPHEVDEAVVREDPGRKEPKHVVVQHVLIGHAGAELPGVTRTLPEAERVARRVLDEARGGADFGELVRLYGDDRTNDGVLSIANYGVTPRNIDETGRTGLVKAFGDAAFALEIGQIVLVEHDEARSPYGYHVVTRLR